MRRSILLAILFAIAVIIIGGCSTGVGVIDGQIVVNPPKCQSVQYAPATRRVLVGYAPTDSGVQIAGAVYDGSGRQATMYFYPDYVDPGTPRIGGATFIHDQLDWDNYPYESVTFSNGIHAEFDIQVEHSNVVENSIWTWTLGNTNATRSASGASSATFVARCLREPANQVASRAAGRIINDSGLTNQVVETITFADGASFKRTVDKSTKDWYTWARTQHGQT